MEQDKRQRAERDIFNIGTVQGNVIVQNNSRPMRPRNEQILLRIVKDEIASRLASSLHNSIFLILDKEIQPAQVQQPWEREIKIGPTAKIAGQCEVLDL